MLGAITKLFDSNDKEIKKLQPIVDEINSYDSKFKKLKDSDFPKKTEEFKKRIEKGESIFAILPEAFALVREAAHRAVGMRPYDVQLMAAAALASGKVAEQKTGEGKTLSAVPALYLNALSGKTVHLVTVNDYLARRDAGWMGAVFSFLGMSVSTIISEASFLYDPSYKDESAADFRLFHLKPITRQEAYKANVVYGINSEFGFDYLRDNMATDPAALVQTDHFFAVIDEVDSVLIDEARTPHIISMPDTTPSQKYYEYAHIVDKLTPEDDYKIDEKMRTAHLTDQGIEKVERMYKVKDIYEKDFETVYHIEAALKANTLYQIDRDYIVRDGQVILVDEFTGRLLEGRRLSEGLHQAIEAKENVEIQQESKTLATISLQNYFRRYEKLGGMTGTAVTEAEEFQKIYKLDVVVVPTHRDMVRDDEGDQIYKTVNAKIKAVADKIEEAHKTGQPVLVGTTSIEKNEVISQALKRRGIIHEVLNAKNHIQEAMIIAQAGKRGAVTVATNMAGRGVDIILGGQPPSSFDVAYSGAKGAKKLEKDQAEWEKNHTEVVGLGGLFVIGTEKHESRRIDNQLRGRAGRQGDPGKSVFVVSLEDDLMRIFGGDQISGLMTRFNFPEDQPLAHGLVSKVIEQAQVKVEGFNFESRKHTLDYDDVLNQQREIVYKNREDILLDRTDVIESVLEKANRTIAAIVEVNLLNDTSGDAKKKLIEEFSTIIPFDEHSRGHLLDQINNLSGEKITEFLTNIPKQLVDAWDKQFGRDLITGIYKAISLNTIDQLWMTHLTSMEDLRTGIGLRGMGQRDPLVEYKSEAFTMFERLVAEMDDETVRRAFRIDFSQIAPQINTPPQNLELNQPASEVSESKSKTPKEEKVEVTEPAEPDTKKKLGRNDPCWCGSGKKWKKCHYPQLPA